ncbi:TonB-dependent receptor [uncultured Sphingomonas sp.]|uniref:TonB-dependent receptor n=1 Tax=uncultured Sphingomonas sp. TaxID=158754 RepID=UPI0025FC1E7B|nr:TonB-dependent receptor [uncultured Sphingomonas sp.]
MRVLVLLLASSILPAAPALAQQRSDQAPHGAEDHEHQGSHDIIVTAPHRGDLDLLAGTSVLSGEDLQRELRPQIGDTLTRLPGVSATSFSPGASRPVLRGFQGERIRVLTDGIGSIDVSNTSADHAVTIDPLTAERVEVLRGPAVLLFGSQAIGGAVNVIDRRIPRGVPAGGYHVDVIGALGSAADERSVGASGDLAFGNSGLVLHVDGNFVKTDDLETGGYVLSPRLRAEQLELVEEALEEGELEEAAEAEELAGLRGKVPNSATEQKSGGIGLAYIKGPLSLGVSYGRFESDYGVPTRPGAGHHHEEEEGGELPVEEEEGEAPVTIGLRQNRFDLRGEYRLEGGFLESVRLRAGASNYRHTEFEGEEVGTVFKSKGAEGRLELAQAERNGWSGASGVQYFRRDFEAIGAEAFVPPNKTDQVGLFTLQELDLGRLGLEIGARLERTNVRSSTVEVRRRFDAFSVAGGVSYELATSAKVGFNLSRTTRAPSAEELFSNGPHIATQAFEIGDPNLRKERSLGGELYFRWDRPTYNVSATAFLNRFSNFIYEAETGEEIDELPVFQYFQRDATYRGVEVEASARLGEVRGVRIVADVVGDYVRATIKSGGPVPRIPPLRLLGGLEAQSERWDARAEVEWIDDQTRVAAFETTTEGFTRVNASVVWHPWGKRNETSLILSANNIFDEEARRHASFTKDFVPLAGRDIRLSAHFSF